MAKNNNKQFAKSNISQGPSQQDVEFGQEMNATTNNNKQSISKQSNKKQKS